ncbi:hypothetical protein M9H77_35329 [Catharanthus roseus]|uniref:Uncharacterized protein n=1 Tax=Catharanthus roseus TaxID=4058 RepID=A0ACB9ZNQ0_CATRO|nr:hypothetical protein M9H77_35329 [Catharanthus roseus]
MKFHIGDRVEVEGYDKGLQESYFSGMVIHISRENGDYRIKYDNLHKNENSSKKLKEYVDPFFVLPKLPLIQDPCYSLHKQNGRWVPCKVHKERIKNTKKFNASSSAGASSSKPRPNHR